MAVIPLVAFRFGSRRAFSSIISLLSAHTLNKYLKLFIIENDNNSFMLSYLLIIDYLNINYEIKEYKVFSERNMKSY